jgi:hypothetical protein
MSFSATNCSTSRAMLLETIPGLVVVVGVEDNEPQLAAPYAVVYSDIVGFQGINPIYEFHRSVRLFRIPLNSETLLKSWNLT